MLETKLEKTVKILLYLIPFLPLIFIQGFYFPFIIGKTIYFRLLLQAALSLYIILLIADYNKYKIKINAALVLTVIFFLINLLAGIFGLNFYKSFWSIFERMEGLISIIYLIIYLFLLQAFLKTKKDWLFYIRIILSVSFLVSLYGLVQKFNILPVFQAGTDRIASTIGNAAFLAGFLLLSIGLGIYYGLNETDKKYKIATAVIVALDLLVLILTLTRGAILGLAFGLIVFCILAVFFSDGRLRKYSIAALVILILVASSFVVFRKPLAGSSNALIKRLTTISLNDPTIINRLAVWKMALAEAKARPILGVGMENFDIVYNKFYNPSISEEYFDRTHNIYLDQLMSGGILGLAAYLAILLYLVYRLFKKRKTDFYFFAVFTGLLTAYGIHNFFVFDTINTSFLFFFLVGLISVETSGVSEDVGRQRTPGNNLAGIILLLLLLINIFAFYKLVYLPVKINRYLYNGYYYILADTNRSYESFKTSLSYKFGSEEAANQLNSMFAVLDDSKTADSSQLEKFYLLTREKLEFAETVYPLDIRAKLHLGQLLINYGTTRADLDEAEKTLKECVNLSPTRPQSYYLLYNLYLKENQAEKAKGILMDLNSRLPLYGEAKIMLANLLAASDPKSAAEYFNQGINQPYVATESMLKLILKYLLDNKRYAEAVPYYLKLIGAAPDAPGYRIDLAKIYYLTGDINSAIEQINLVNAKSPEALKDDKQFLNLLYDTYKKSF